MSVVADRNLFLCYKLFPTLILKQIIITFELQYNKYVFWVNLLTPRNDQHVTSPYNIILFQAKQVKILNT